MAPYFAPVGSTASIDNLHCGISGGFIRPNGAVVLPYWAMTVSCPDGLVWSDSRVPVRAYRCRCHGGSWPPPNAGVSCVTGTACKQWYYKGSVW